MEYEIAALSRMHRSMFVNSAGFPRSGEFDGAPGASAASAEFRFQSENQVSFFRDEHSLEIQRPAPTQECFQLQERDKEKIHSEIGCELQWIDKDQDKKRIELSLDNADQ